MSQQNHSLAGHGSTRRNRTICLIDYVNYITDSTKPIDTAELMIIILVIKILYEDNKTEKFTPRFISVLHTFGRDLKWNPHIHCLVCEEALDTKKIK